MYNIKAIIFDLGGVILNLDQERTIRAFNRLGADLELVNLESHLFTDFETGKITSQEFRTTIKEYIGGPIHEQVIDDAWNAMLLELPNERLKLIEQLKKHFKVALLSNTNEIHIQYFNQYLAAKEQLEQWNNLFDEIFLSYQMGLRKPDLSIYQEAAKKLNVATEQCLFIDDNLNNIKAAEKAGMKVIWAKEPLGSHSLNEIKSAVSMRF